MMTDTPFNQAYQRCIYLLARREYSQLELRQKLSQLDINTDIIEECLNRLLAENYQSDKRFAEMFCRTRINQRHGKQKIRYELKQKGIAENLIDSVLSEYDTEWVDNAMHLIMRKAPRGDIKKVMKDYPLKSKIIRFLLGKGYDYDTINLAFEALKNNEE